MSKIVVIIDENGVYQNSYTDCEVDLQVLKRGTDDAQIDVVEAELEPIE